MKRPNSLNHIISSPSVTKTVAVTPSPPLTHCRWKSEERRHHLAVHSSLSLPLPPCRDSWLSRHWGVAVYCNWGPQFQVQRCTSWWHLADSQKPRCARELLVICVWCKATAAAKASTYWWRRQPLLLMLWTMMTSTTLPRCSPPTEMRRWRRWPYQRMDETGQGPRRSCIQSRST